MKKEVFDGFKTFGVAKLKLEGLERRETGVISSSASFKSTPSGGGVHDTVGERQISSHGEETALFFIGAGVCPALAGMVFYCVQTTNSRIFKKSVLDIELFARKYSILPELERCVPVMIFLINVFVISRTCRNTVQLCR